MVCTARSQGTEKKLTAILGFVYGSVLWSNGEQQVYDLWTAIRSGTYRDGNVAAAEWQELPHVYTQPFVDV